MSYYVYIIRSDKDGSYYVGSTQDYWSPACSTQPRQIKVHEENAKIRLEKKVNARITQNMAAARNMIMNLAEMKSVLL